MQQRDQYVRDNCLLQICWLQAQNDQAVSMNWNFQETTEEQWLWLEWICNKDVEDYVSTDCT